MDSQIIVKGKQSRLLLALRDQSQSWYISSLAKASGTTYVHACNFLNTCESMGIVQSEKHGKIKLIKLTEKGTKLADALAALTTMIGQVQQPQQQKPQPAEQKKQEQKQ